MLVVFKLYSVTGYIEFLSSHPVFKRRLLEMLLHCYGYVVRINKPTSSFWYVLVAGVDIEEERC